MAPKKPEPIIPKFIRHRGGKITIDLNAADKAIDGATSLTASFLRKLGQDGAAVAKGIKIYLEKKAQEAEADVRAKRGTK